MAHHKRGKPKNARAGCLLCHPEKMNGQREAIKRPFRDLRKIQVDNKHRDKYQYRDDSDWYYN